MNRILSNHHSKKLLVLVALAVFASFNVSANTLAFYTGDPNVGNSSGVSNIKGNTQFSFVYQSFVVPTGQL